MRTATILSAALAACSLALGAACSSGLPSDPSPVEKVERAAGPDPSRDRPQPEVTVPGPRFGPDTSPNRQQP